MKDLVELLQSWIEEGDAREQQEAGEHLIEALDQERLSGRRLFPPELDVFARRCQDGRRVQGRR